MVTGGLGVALEQGFLMVVTSAGEFGLMTPEAFHLHVDVKKQRFSWLVRDKQVVEDDLGQDRTLVGRDFQKAKEVWARLQELMSPNQVT